MILNLTQHKATPEQIAAGVIEPSADAKERICNLLTIEDLPDTKELQNRSETLADIVVNRSCKTAMIGGAPFLMSHLEKALKSKRIQPLYAFSKRVVIETTQEDGDILKKAIFKHLGFVEA